MIKEISMYDKLRERLIKIEPEKKILCFEGKKITIRELLYAIDHISVKLGEMGVERGDVVTMNLPNTMNAVILFYAVNKLGAIVNSLHPLIPVGYMVQTAEKTKSKLLILLDQYYAANAETLNETDIKRLVCRVSDYLPFIKKLIYKQKEKAYGKKIKGALYYSELIKEKNVAVTESAFNRVAAYLHSGGTSSEPKTVMLSNKAFNALSDNLSNVKENMDSAHNSCLMVLPIFHGFGLGVCMHTMLTLGFKVALMPKFNAKQAAAIIKKENITIVAGVPLLYEKLYNLPDKDFKKLKTLESAFGGGDKLPSPLKHKLDARLKSIGSIAETLEGYGLTEVVTVCCVNIPNDFRENSMGFPLPDTKVRILNTETREILPIGEKGEIFVSADTIMDGYLEGSADNMITLDGDKYVATGDCGYTDTDGRLYFVDRIKRIIKVSGITIFPSDIEKTVNSVAGVCNSVAVYDEERRKVIAHVETGAELTDADAEALKRLIIEKCKKELISYSVPADVLFYEILPRTLVGKIKVK